jgi:hypothetical protein
MLVTVLMANYQCWTEEVQRLTAANMDAIVWELKSDCAV